MTINELIWQIEEELDGELTAEQQYCIKAIVGANPITDKIIELCTEYIITGKQQRVIYPNDWL